MRWFINFLTKYLLIAPTVSDIIYVQQDKTGKTVRIQLGNEKMTENEKRNIQEEAKFLVKTRLWSILINSTTEHARQRMFELSKSDQDMVFGKAILYTTDLQRKLVEKILNS